MYDKRSCLHHIKGDDMIVFLASGLCKPVTKDVRLSLTYSTGDCTVWSDIEDVR